MKENPFNAIKTALSDIIQFNDSVGNSKSGALRLEIQEKEKTAILSIALPDPTVPQLPLLCSVAIVFISVLLPSYPKAETILMESSNRFGAGFDSVIAEESKEGSLSLSYNRHASVYELAVKLL